MARLNEPMVSTDSIETLRRKFLRQNRDIARTNSTQSLKIRSLENECARMLSENLDLRGQILRLETELRESRAQRIADHAMEIKEKMEAQLIEWGSMLASLGHEPIAKNRSPRASKKAKRSSFGRSSGLFEWRRRETLGSMKDLEAAAQQEGRLPPLWENKSYPRETLNQEDILALRAVVEEDSAESPDLGPPPVSRFVDEDPVKIDLPAKPTAIEPDTSTLKTVPPKPETKPAPLEAAKQIEHPVKEEVVMKDAQSSNDESSTKKTETKNEQSIVKEVGSKSTKPPTAVEQQAITQAAKVNLKRKQREEDEKENAPVSKPITQNATSTKTQPEKAANLKNRPMNRPMKELPSSKRDARDKATVSTTQRKPLGAKSANEVVNSPKKATKPPVLDEVTKAKADQRRDEKVKDRAKPKKEMAPIEIPAPAPALPAAVASIEMEPETPSAEPNLAIPDSPATSASREEVADTPPPTDISSRGETSRGSRRARPAVSYAEPNLRDKMRRPTKQLLDAVSGEGKHVRRASHSRSMEPHSASSSMMIKSEDRPGAWKDLPLAAAQGASTSESQALEIMASPLVQKTSRATSVDDLPTSVTVTDRKKRNSTIPAADGSDQESSSSGSSMRSGTGRVNRKLDEIAAREAEVAKLFDGPDVYEFLSASPRKDDAKRPSTAEEQGATGSKRSKGTRHPRSRRLSSMAREDLDMDGGDNHAERGGAGGSSSSRQAGGSRKRASMMAPKKSRMSVDEGEEGGPGSAAEADSSLGSVSSADTEVVGARDRGVSVRRRSMMI